MDVLKAQDHLRGKIDAHAPQELKDERLEWIRANSRARKADMAEALGIPLSCTYRLCYAAGLRKVGASRKGIKNRGLHIGSALAPILAMPAEAQDALEARAAKTGQTLAQVLAVAWVEGMT